MNNQEDTVPEIGYADVVAVYAAAEVGGDAWTVADEWLRYLALRADGKRLMVHAQRREAGK